MKTALKTGSWLALLTGLLHTLAHFQEARPQSEREGQMLELMRSVRFDAGGVERSMWEILAGLSLCFSLLLLLMGLHGLRMARSDDAGSVRDTARLYALAAAALTAVGVLHFPTPAFVMTGLMFVAYLVAALKR